MSDELKDGLEDELSPKIVLKKEGLNSFEMHKHKKNKSLLN
jgi:hypothetical protein